MVSQKTVLYSYIILYIKIRSMYHTKFIYLIWTKISRKNNFLSTLRNVSYFTKKKFLASILVLLHLYLEQISYAYMKTQSIIHFILFSNIVLCLLLYIFIPSNCHVRLINKLLETIF